MSDPHSSASMRSDYKTLMKTNRILMVLLSVMAVQVALAGDKIIVMGHNVENFFYSTDRTLTAEGNPNTLVYYTDEEGLPNDLLTPPNYSLCFRYFSNCV